MVKIRNSRDTFSKVMRWFGDNGFRVANFQEKSSLLICNYHLGHTLTFKLFAREGFTTFIKEGSGGSLIVFEVKKEQEGVKLFGYCPILLFGIWPKKLSFKKGAKLLSYRAEGFELECELMKILPQGFEK